MPTDTTHQTLILQLRTEIDRLYDRAADPGSSQFRSKYDEVATLWEKLRDLTSKSQSGDIADFFDAIGSGVIGAQKRLDRASEEYVRSALYVSPDGTEDGSSASATLPANASMFRIPRVTAELKCSLETNHDKKLNLIFYSDRNDVRELHQQTISLEVVAVPVPPDYLNQLKTREQAQEPSDEEPETDEDRNGPIGGSGAKVPQIFSLSSDEPEEPAALDRITQSMAQRLTEADSHKESFHMPTIDSAMRSSSLPAVMVQNFLQQKLSDGSDRREVKELLEKLVEKADPKQLKSQGLADVQRRLLPAWERALVFTDAHNTRFVLLAMTDKQPRLLLWQLVLRPASLRLLYKLPKQKQFQQEQARLQRFVAGLGDAQAAARRIDG